MRTAIKNKILSNSKRIQISVELGSDVDNDGIVDSWSSYSKWQYKDESDHSKGKECNIYDNASLNSGKMLTIIQEEKVCNLAHPFENISAKKLRIVEFSFAPYPDRDPFLSFRNDSSQIHPNVFLFMKIDLENAQVFGFKTTPTITMQTNVSSRIFDNTRK
jgi:hypothetical protein